MPIKTPKFSFLLAAAFFGSATLFGAQASANDGRIQTAFLHDSHGAHHDAAHHHYKKGCFVTTSHQGHARGVRHFVSPCPHKERHHMNPHHKPYHKHRH